MDKAAINALLFIISLLETCSLQRLGNGCQFFLSVNSSDHLQQASIVQQLFPFQSFKFRKKEEYVHSCNLTTANTTRTIFFIQNQKSLLGYAEPRDPSEEPADKNLMS
jgi:hypothetical protein